MSVNGKNGLIPGDPSKYDPKPPKKKVQEQEPPSGFSTLWRKITTPGEILCLRNCDVSAPLPWWTNKADQKKVVPKVCKSGYDPRTSKCRRGNR